MTDPLPSPPAMSVPDLEERIRRLEAVVGASALTNTTLDLTEIAERIVETAVRLIGAERGSLFLLDSTLNVLLSLVAQGVTSGQLRVPLGEGIVGTVATTGEPIVIDDPYSDARFDRRSDDVTGYRTRSLLTVPVKDRNGCLVAVLQLLNHETGAFSSRDVGFLEDLATPFAVALVTARLHALSLERERIRQELRLAARIQNTLRPASMAAIPGLDLAVRCEPCLEVGGDYYDAIPGRDSSWWLLMADISGKGVAAALIASNVQALLWSRREDPRPLGDAMSDMGDLLHRLAQGRKYATLALVHWHPATRVLEWVNAGHLPILLKRGSEVSQLSSGGVPFGLLPGASYPCGKVQLASGDTFLLLTDGVTEAGEDLGLDEFGMSRVIDALMGEVEPESILESISTRMAEYLLKGRPSDDVTMLCGRCQ